MNTFIQGICMRTLETVDKKLLNSSSGHQHLRQVMKIALSKCCHGPRWNKCSFIETYLSGYSGKSYQGSK